MVAIGQIGLAEIEDSRGLGPGATGMGLDTEVQDKLGRRAEVDSAVQRATAGARPPAGDGQSSAGNQVGGAANVNRANAAASGDSQQLEIREGLAIQDQQLPVPVDPNRGTRLDIAV